VPGPERPSSARAILLLLLAENPQHGYELQPQIVRLMGTSYNGAGMYRTLRKLEEEELVTSSWEPAPIPGPARRTYCLTAAGRAELEVHVSQLKRSARQIRMFLRRHAALHDRNES
jgi:PadR family transcriptional regulator PadR